MNIIELAKQAGFQDADWNYTKGLEKFVKLIRADEREACAKLIENTDLGGLASDSKLQLWVAALLYEYAKAIRARGNT